ncbi:hypothetical protein ACC697_39515, partial [Rhizobium ruizarguesonis]
LFANFSPETDFDGYMETFMNWALLLRSEREMGLIASESVTGADVNVPPGLSMLTHFLVSFTATASGK